MHAGEKATSYYEAKSDWEICSRLIAAIERRAAAKGHKTFTDRFGNARPFEGLSAMMSSGGKFGLEDETRLTATLVEASSNVEGSWEEMKRKGFLPFTGTGTGKGATSISTMTDFKPGETITPLTHHVIGKVPYPTLTRRMQFYIDQELYLEFGEQLPVHKVCSDNQGESAATIKMRKLKFPLRQRKEGVARL